MKRIACLILASFVYIPFSYSANSPKHYKDEVKKIVVPCCVASLQDGLYAGIGLGYDAYRIQQGISVTDTTGVLDQANPGLSAKGTVGNIFIGYGQYYDWFYIAGEALFNYSGADDSFSLNNYHSRVNLRTSFGASLLPGLKLSPSTLLYGRLGYIRSYLSAKENMPGAFQQNTTAWSDGLQLGLGLETLIYRYISLRTEYSYTYYTSFNSPFPISTHFAPANNQFILSMVYHFNYP